MSSPTPEAADSRVPVVYGHWPPSIASTTITDPEVAEAIELAVPYIMIDTELGPSAYRLAPHFVEGISMPMVN
jgi:hypothetical protein